MTPAPKRQLRCTARRQRGLAMVEFAIGMPVVFLLWYAACELGNVFVQYATLADAARNADRYLVSNALLGSTGVVDLSSLVPNAANPTTLAQAAQNLVVYGNINGAGTALLPGLATTQVTIAVDTSNNVSVSVAYPYQSLFGGSIPDFVDQGPINTNFTLTVFTSTVAL